MNSMNPIKHTRAVLKLFDDGQPCNLRALRNKWKTFRTRVSLGIPGGASAILECVPFTLEIIQF